MNKKQYFLLTLLLATTATPQVAHAKIGRTVAIVGVFGTATIAWINFLRLQQEHEELDTNTKTKLALLATARTLCKTTENLSGQAAKTVEEFGNNIFAKANDEAQKKLTDAKKEIAQKEAAQAPVVTTAKKTDVLENNVAPDTVSEPKQDSETKPE